MAGMSQHAWLRISIQNISRRFLFKPAIPMYKWEHREKMARALGCGLCHALIVISSFAGREHILDLVCELFRQPRAQTPDDRLWGSPGGPGRPAHGSTSLPLRTIPL